MDMNTTCLDTNSPGIRTVLHMSPAVMAAVMPAQKCGLGLREWLDRAVANLIADDHPEGAAPWSVQSAELFTDVANCSPELLHGRWSRLYERVRLERELWHRVSLTATIGSRPAFDCAYLALAPIVHEKPDGISRGWRAGCLAKLD